MSRGHEDRIRQKFDEKMRRSAEKAKGEKAARQAPPASTVQSGDPHVKEALEKK
jgi:hypothetical protein